MKAYAPDGTLIVATKEIIPGEAAVAIASFHRKADGTLSFDHIGETDVDWDGQETVTQEGKMVFIDADGDEWTEDQLTLKAE